MTSGVTKCSSLLEVLNSQTSQFGESCEVLSIFAGAVYWETWEQFTQNINLEHELSRLLEVRAYTRRGEFHAQRSNIDATCPFVWRTIVDADDGSGQNSFDDVQRIDRDEKRIAADPDGLLYTTGGGKYCLPDADATRIRLRNYIEYDDDGIARIVDFRIVGLEDTHHEDGVC